MIKRYFINIVALIFCVTTSYGQSVSFLNYFSDARTAAMGNTGYALSSPFAVQRNVTTIMGEYLPATAIGASYLLWQPQATNSNLINVAGYTKLGKVGLAAGIRYHTLDIVEQTDDYGNMIRPFTPSEYTLEVGLGYKINANIATGVALRYVSSDMNGEKKGSAVAADISMLYERENLSIGLGCSNLGSKMNYGYSDYALPMRIQAGISYRFLDKDKHRVTGVADAAYQSVFSYNGTAASIGAEYTYNDLISLRAGYRFENESIGASYATVGCGLYLSGISVDFAYALSSNNNPMRQTMLVSLSWGISNKR